MADEKAAEKTPRQKKIRTPEVAAFMKIDALFEGLSAGARARLAAYVAERYASGRDA